VAYGYYFIRKKEGMGGGDIKLLAMIGAFLGWRAIPFVLFSASVMGSIIGILWILFQGKDRNFPIPFGPFLALGAIWVIFFPGSINLFLFY
ncbi:MAG TPA: prepilin peptidase, partial [Candidatus Desulfofervidus auxilii]|nr:prepilin peptidase [Candidatus Desulfofervidus auxilii]